MVSKLILAIFLGVTAGLLAGLYSFWSPQFSFLSKTMYEHPVSIGGPFTLVDTSGKGRTERDFFGKPMLVFFGFTQCPDICPSGLQTLTLVLSDLGDALDSISIVFVTIDPERDTPENLAAYLQSFHKKIIGLSGTSEQVNRIIKAYRVYTKKIPNTTEKMRYTFDHSSFFYLMDSRGKYVKHFPSSLPYEKLSFDLKYYLENLKPSS